MALSFYSNSETYESEINDAILGFNDPVAFSIDSLFNSSPLENNTITEPIYTDSSVMSLPKRQKCTNNVSNYFEEEHIARCNGYFYQGPQLNFASNIKNGNGNGNGSPSVQSVAARERRRKISEKTQELGKLIPGGNKMSTAEMFLAAYKYVKFLQAQIGILGLMSTFQVGKNSKEVVELLEVVLNSKVLEEKLMKEEKCLVPRIMIDTLTDVEIRSNPFITKDITKDLVRFKKLIGQ